MTVETLTHETLSTCLLEYLKMRRWIAFDHAKHALLLGGPKPGLVYSCVEDLLLRHGSFWTPRALPARYRKRPVRQCFHNTGDLVRRSKALRYVEGYAAKLSLGIPMHHAWAVDGEGRVVDTTWDNPEGAVYFGVAFPREQLAEQTPDNGSLLYSWGRDLLSEPWPT